MIKTPPLNTKEFFKKTYEETVLPEDRKKLLGSIAEMLINVYEKDQKVNLNFICTHNSRRSQLGQVWASFATEYFEISIASFSGGTEVTAFHKNTVKTLQEVGFIFNIVEFSHQNPVYNISFEGSKKNIVGFSKIYDNPVNVTPFIAITTCNSADANCPFIPEALQRFHLPYVDPKFSDGTAQQQETYLATNRQVAAEMFYLFSMVQKAV
jgi:arsenate reductase